MSGITYIKRIDGATNSLVQLDTTDTLATATAAGYITAQHANIVAANDGEWTWETNDLVILSASDGLILATINAAFTKLTIYSTAGNGAVTLPVVADDFVMFSGTLGALYDKGFSASDPAKTKVVMANGAVTLNHLATYKDTAGTIGQDAATAINGGNLQAGLSGTAGTVASYPSAATSGSLLLAAVTNSSGNFNTTISNASAVGQSQVVSIPDGGSSTSNFLISNSASSQTIATGNLVVAQGNVVAGSSGHAGTLASFPSGATSGELLLAAVTNSGGNFNTTISNASSIAQSQVISIPDSGATTANFILSKNATTQHITAGALQVDAGALISGLSTGGFVGKLQLFPTTTTTGSLSWTATPNSGNTATVFTTAAYGQASTITFPDPAGATAAGVLAPSALVSGNLVKASGTAGLIVDQGVAFKSVAGAAAAGGNAAQSFTDAFSTTGSCIVGNWNTQANAASVLKIVPGNGSFVVTSDADAGVGTFNYIITK